jgi:cardiolipin synthase
MATGNMLVAGILLAASFLTDFLDGWLARTYNWTTDLGKFLDPAADKLTQVVVSITLIIVMRSYWYLFAFLVLKDLVMGLLGAWLLKRHVRIGGANWSGKVATFIYYFTVVIIAIFPDAPQWIIIALLCLMVTSALIAGLSYIPDFKRYRQQAAQ